MKELKDGQLVRVIMDATGEFIGYHGQVIGEANDDGTYAIDFTYNMTRLPNNKWGAYFSPGEVEKEVIKIGY